MTAEEYWKNWRLGTELRLSGNFIYNGIHCFDQMEHFVYEEEIFEFLYNIAVGIERLQKVLIILQEYGENVNNDKFEKELITHNHVELINRIKKNVKFTLGKPHNKFLSLLTSFYKSIRYERYSLSSVFMPNSEQKRYIEFIEDNLGIEVSISFIGCTSNDKKIKKFQGKIIGKIVNQLYDLIIEECDKLNIYTYEVSSTSKAYKIFAKREFDFENDKIFQKEILLSLLNKAKAGKLNHLLTPFPPLELDDNDSNLFIINLINPDKRDDFDSEIEYLYEEGEVKNIGERIRYLEMLGNPDVFIDEGFKSK